MRHFALLSLGFFACDRAAERWDMPSPSSSPSAAAIAAPQATLGPGAATATATATATAPASGVAPNAQANGGPRDSAVAHAAPAPSDDAQWLLRGTPEERWPRVAAHFRGFDMAMVETGYRYSELYAAAASKNWDYGAYQLAKIETAIARGLERRPKRAASAKLFESAVTQTRAALAARDPAQLAKALTAMTQQCNICHQAERVPFIVIAKPQSKSLVQAPTPK